MIFVLASLSLAPVLQAVGWALLHLVWQGAVIAAALALVLALLPSRSANARYAISCAALALLIVVGVLTGWRAYAAGAPGAPPTVHRTMRQVAAESVRLRAPVAAPAPTLAMILVATWAPARAASVPDPWRAASNALPAIVSLWLAGVTLLSLRLIAEWLCARRLVREHAQPACEPWLAMARSLGAALGVRQAVRLLESTAIRIPAVIGLLRPVILLPADTLSGLLPGQLEMILAHELAHIRRHDFLVNLLQAAVETLLFYHPAVWWISKQVRIEREHCCDDLAVGVCGSPLQYARALTRLEELRVDALPLVLSARGGSLLHRIRRVVARPAPSAGPVRGVTAMALLFGLLLAFAAPSLTAIAKPQPVAVAHASAAAPASGAAEAPVRYANPSACPRVAGVDRAEAAEAAARAAVSAVATVTRSIVEPVVGTVVASIADPDPDPDPGVETDLAPNSNAAIASGHLRLTVDELIALRSQGVTTANILEMRFLFPDIDVRDIAGMYAVGATPKYVRTMRAAGIDVRSAKEAQGMAAVGVTPEFIADMRAAGLDVDDAGAATELAAVGVTSGFIRGMRAAGLRIASADEAKTLAAVGATPDFVRGLRAEGLSLASACEAKALAAVGVTPDFVRNLRATGLRLDNANEARDLATVGVTADYVREMRSAGVAIRDANDAKSLIVVGVTPEFVRRLARAGYKNLSPSSLCRLGAGGVTGDLVEELSQYRTR